MRAIRKDVPAASRGATEEATDMTNEFESENIMSGEREPEFAPTPEPVPAPAPHAGSVWTNVWDTPAQELPHFEEAAAPAAPQPAPIEEGGVYTAPVFTVQEEAQDAYSPNYCRGGYAYEPAAVQRPAEKKHHTGLGRRIAAVALAAVICAGASAGAAALVTDAKLKNATLTAQDKDSSGRTVVVNTLPAATGDGKNSTTTAKVDGSELTGSEIYELACKQVVAISITGVTNNVYFGQSQYTVSGSGFILSEDGYIMTNYHVIEYALNGDEIQVMLEDGSTYTAEIVGYEKENDVAVLKINATGLSAVTIGSFDSMLVGESVYCVGNPTGMLAYSMSDGIISAKDREITTEAARDVNMFQITAAVNEGISGGPVYNTRGEVIGIVTAKYNDAYSEGLGFAIPIDDAMSIATDLIETGHVTGKAYLGVVVTTLENSAIQYYNLVPGAAVSSVFAGSAAEKAGIQVGDIITALGDTEVTSADELRSARRAYRAGDTVEITIYRNGETLKLMITFDEENAVSYSTEIPEDQTNPYPSESGSSGGYSGNPGFPGNR